ncbi:hypothetical protein O6H91_16G068000 [Diphasiastrum complanatum]|uniref:Uncharacterized protein n=1 Tax=Diphasiastrum complanatum TaxID=34168 RepID=A0ACC2BD89_DIPCM|nr:hypothetical protein O6H91_16G068000 [Diphasiastrum complanatum]
MWLSFLLLLFSASLFTQKTVWKLGVNGLGVNWGTISSHPLPPSVVVNLLQANKISKVKLFDADSNVVGALAGTGIEVMVAIPNEMLEMISSSMDAANNWVHDNVTHHTFTGGVNIRYVAVGNEPFLRSYNGTFNNVTLPALLNIQKALSIANLTGQVKATVPLNADVLSNGNSTLPSGGIFRPDIHTLMLKLASFLHKNGAPFSVNIYPFLSLQQNVNFPEDFAFFEGTQHALIDGPRTYTNVFDASYDMLVTALEGIGYPNMPIIVGEVGWPTDGDMNANLDNARRFNQELVNHALSGKGTPLRPGKPIELYLFGLIDEDKKSIAPGNFERHWGIYSYDGRGKYALDLSGKGRSNFNLPKAEGVSYLPLRWCVLNPSGDMSKLAENVGYACTSADCTALTYGGSCNSIGGDGNASYAFNNYYQLNNQNKDACYFDGLGMVTTEDPSIGSCKFPVQLVPSYFDSAATTYFTHLSITITMGFATATLSFVFQF